VKFCENIFPYFSNYKHNLDTDNNQPSNVFDYSFEPVNDDSYTGEVYNQHNHGKALSYLQDYHYQLSNHTDIENLKNTNKKAYPISEYLDYKNLTSK